MDYLKVDLGQGPDGSNLTRWQYSGQIHGIDELQSMNSHSINFENLKLNESQIEKIKLINQQINLIGDLVEPPRNEVDERINNINQEIDSLLFQIKDCTNQIQTKYDERNEYIKKNNPEVDDYETVQGHLFELLSKRNILKQEIQINEKLLASLKTKSKKSAQNQSQLQQSEVENNLQSQYELLIRINDEIAQYNDKRNLIKDQKKSLVTEVQNISEQIKSLKNDILEIKDKIKQKKDEKDQIIQNYNLKFDDYKNKFSQKCLLECDLNKIFLEAEKK